MKSRLIITIGAVAAAMTFTARGDFFDNFDSYANQAAFNAVWAVDAGGSVLALKNDVSFSSPNAVSQSTTASARLWTSLGSTIQGSLLDFSYEFYYTGSGTRDFAQVYSRSGTAWTSGLVGALSVGTFNTTAAGKFAARFTQATPANGAIFGDGATIISTSDTTGWFALNITKTAGWHLMEVIGGIDPDHSGKAIYKFYVDGVLGGSVANAPDSAFGFGVLGGANSTGTGAAVDVARYDNFSVSVVPEPSSLALCLLGGFSLAAWATRRRVR